MDELENDLPNFNDYTEEQLDGVLRFARSVAATSQELEELAETTKRYLSARKAGKHRVTDLPDDKDTDEIVNQITEWRRRSNRK